MYGQTISTGSPGVTSSPESADGISPCGEQDGGTTEQFGQARARVRIFPVPESRQASTASATSGPPSTISSASAALNSSLASRLKTRCATVGSTVYTQTWKERVTPAGLSYWEHIPRGRTTSDKEYTGWPTPNLSDENNSRCASPQEYSERRLSRPNACSQLADTAQALVGWPTCRANDAEKRGEVAIDPRNGLVSAAQLAGWKTPHASDEEGGVMEIRPDCDGHYKLRDQAALAGWATPTVRDMKDTGDMSASMVRADGKERNDTLGRQTFGLNQNPTSAKTENTGVLNPAFSRWLQSFPEAWCRAAVLAFRSMPTKRRKRALCA